MKLGFAILPLVLVMSLTACSSARECSSCGEHRKPAGSCSYCSGYLCSDCLPDVKSNIDDDYEIHYKSGYDDGRSDGYDDGYTDGHEDGYNKGYDDGYYSNDELYFWQNSAVIVTTTGKKYHTYDCYHIEGRNYYIYNTELAKAKGYTACLDCIDW